jgi:hypothetical protein
LYSRTDGVARDQKKAGILITATVAVRNPEEFVRRLREKKRKEIKIIRTEVNFRFTNKKEETLVTFKTLKIKSNS